MVVPVVVLLYLVGNIHSQLANQYDPSYIGCLKSSPIDDFPFTPQDLRESYPMNPLQCAHRCFSFPYFALQNSQCRCGLRANSSGPDLPSACSLPCPGAPSLTCGGPTSYDVWKNSWHETGVGSPLNQNSYFNRVGVSCPSGSYSTGLAHRRGGCQVSKSYTSGDVSTEKCGCCTWPGLAQTGTKFCFNNTVNPWNGGTVTSYSCGGMQAYFGALVGSASTSCTGSSGLFLSTTPQYASITPCDNYEGLVARLSCLAFPTFSGFSMGTPRTVYSGVGAPLTSNTDFQKVGGICDTPGGVLVGYTYARGGCNTATTWTQNITSYSSLCLSPSNSNEGLGIVMQCSTLPSNTYKSSVWRTTGAGAQIAVHGDWERIGATCNIGEAVQGFRYSLSGCDSTSYWFYSSGATCSTPQGISIDVLCLDMSECGLYGCGNSMYNITCSEPYLNARKCICPYGTGTDAALMGSTQFSGCSVQSTKSKYTIIQSSNSNGVLNCIDGSYQTTWNSGASLAWVVLQINPPDNMCISILRFQGIANNVNIQYSSQLSTSWLSALSAPVTNISTTQTFVFSTNCAPYWNISFTSSSSVKITEMELDYISPRVYISFDGPVPQDSVSSVVLSGVTLTPGLVGKGAQYYNQSMVAAGIPWSSPVSLSTLSIEMLVQLNSNFIGSGKQLSLYNQASDTTSYFSLVMSSTSTTSLSLTINFKVDASLKNFVYNFNSYDISKFSSFRHLVFTYDIKLISGQISLYLDGSKIASYTSTGPIDFDYSSIYFGTTASNPVLLGIIDEFSLYDYPLTPNDVLDHWSRVNGVCRTGPVWCNNLNNSQCNGTNYYNWNCGCLDGYEQVAPNYSCNDTQECSKYGCGFSMTNIVCLEQSINYRTCVCPYGYSTQALKANSTFNGCSLTMSYSNSFNLISTWDPTSHPLNNSIDGSLATYWNGTLLTPLNITTTSLMAQCFSSLQLTTKGDVKGFVVYYLNANIWSIAFNGTAALSTSMQTFFFPSMCSSRWQILVTTSYSTSVSIVEFTFGTIRPIFYVSFDGSPITETYSGDAATLTGTRVTGLVGTNAIQISNCSNGVNCQSLRFTKSTPWINPVSSNGFTLEFIYQPDVSLFTNPNPESIIFSQLATTNYTLLVSLKTGSILVFGLSLSSGYTTLQYTLSSDDIARLSNQTIHYFAFTYDAQTVSSNVIDGVNVASGSWSGSITFNPANNPIYIGKSQTNGVSAGGIYDEVAIYEYAISQNDIMDHWERVNKQCHNGTDWCMPNAYCTGVNYFNWTCTCNPGYEMIGNECVDIDECSLYGCGSFNETTCIENQINQRTCVCPLGYLGSLNLTGSDTFPGCSVIPVCEVYGCGTNTCQQPAPRIRICTCLDGLYLIGATNFTNTSISLIDNQAFPGCTDIDECTEAPNPCYPDVCFNSVPPDKYFCGCPPGTSAKVLGTGELKCEDINECSVYGCRLGSSPVQADCSEPSINARNCSCPQYYSSPPLLYGSTPFPGCTAICGDGVVVKPEQCDDGNLNSGDGCSPSCKQEQGWTCVISVCTANCGDGVIVDPLTEQCDDDNVKSGDGCSSNCKLEDGWVCFLPGYPCQTVCGDGKTRGSESCDDWNQDDNDGCSSNCRIEKGWKTTDTFKTVMAPICGDKIVLQQEECDDGNNATGDGCFNCLVESGWDCASKYFCQPICGNGRRDGNEQCDVLPSDPSSAGCLYCRVSTGWDCNINDYTSCQEVCGDGRVVGSETCDDSNSVEGDGCFNCQIEQGWNCLFSVSRGKTVCSEICGDTEVVGKEQCDDGNGANGDGCSSSCLIENGWRCSATCYPICGDGMLFPPETCDDNNTRNGDGCTSKCSKEVGWECLSPGNPCSAICGDGLVLGDEVCDNGSNKYGTGCSLCRLEPGWKCVVSYQCTAQTEICGDSVIVGKEECDDGNLKDEDGCSASCRIEEGWSCGKHKTCQLPRAICGDGMKVSEEGCDDNNTHSEDGCGPSCLVEIGWTCPTPGMPCKEICGDGINFHLQCDDGNLVSGDGCSSNCTLEQGFSCVGAGLPCDCTYTDWIPSPCDSCEKVGSRYRYKMHTAATPNHTLCPTLNDSNIEACIYPCPSTSSTAVGKIKDVLFALNNQNYLVTNGLNWISSVTAIDSNTLFINVTNCSMNSTVQFQNITNSLLPTTDSTSSTKETNCGLYYTLEDPVFSYRDIIIGAVIGAVALFVIILVIALVLQKRSFERDNLNYLPPAVRAQFEQYFSDSIGWEKVNVNEQTNENLCYRKKLTPGGEEWKFMEDLFFNHLHGKGFILSEAYAIYNQTLITNFVNFRKVLQTRARDPHIYCKQTWKQKEDATHRSFVYEKYIYMATAYPWNEPDCVFLIPAIHGTNRTAAWKICSTGFSPLQALDAGYFGRGNYFTTYTHYALPYFAKHRNNAALLVSYISPGNVYPVTEHHKSKNSLAGQGISGGYNSNYVLTNRGGNCIKENVIEDTDLEYYDELVIDQDAQICPAYVLCLDDSNFQELIVDWTTKKSNEKKINDRDLVLLTQTEEFEPPPSPLPKAKAAQPPPDPEEEKDFLRAL